MKMNVGNFAKSAVLATGILAGSCCLGSCNKTKSPTEIVDQTIAQAEKDLDEAKKQCEKDSIDFYEQAPDSVAAKKRCEALDSKYGYLIFKHDFGHDIIDWQKAAGIKPNAHDIQEHKLVENAKQTINKALEKAYTSTGIKYKNSKANLQNKINDYEYYKNNREYLIKCEELKQKIDSMHESIK